jgi:hypothetical protein
VALIVIGFIAFVSFTGGGDSSISQASIDAATKDAASLLQSGVVKRFDCHQSHDAYLDPVAWAALDVTQKEHLTMILATSCLSTGDRQFVHILSNQTGKEIAQFYGGAFKVF